MKTIFSISFSCILIFLSCSFNGNDRSKANDEKSLVYSLSLKLIAGELEGPVGMAVANDGSDRLFVIEQQGIIRIVKNEKLLAKPFLDVTSKIDNLSGFYSEKGLLGLAFHPQYKSNGKFYVYYSAPTSVKGMDH